MELGEYNTLEVLREAEHGYYLGDEEGNDVLIPMKWVPEDIEIGGSGDDRTGKAPRLFGFARARPATQRS